MTRYTDNLLYADLESRRRELRETIMVHELEFVAAWAGIIYEQAEHSATPAHVLRALSAGGRGACDAVLEALRPRHVRGTA